MCIIVKYGIWNVSNLKTETVNTFVSGGYSPLTAMVLAARGIPSLAQAEALLRSDAPLVDPFRMRDMDLAAARVGLAMARGEKIAVFGDYDVDTCIISDLP